MHGFDELTRRQQEHIDTVGWSVMMVLPTRDDPGVPFAYTVGLTAHDFPELVISGLPHETCHTLLNDLAARVYDQAQRFTHRQRVPDLLSGYDAIIVDGLATDILIPNSCYARYGHDAVRLQQVVWPDQDGNFPWDAGYMYPPHVQPLLDTAPNPPRA